MARIRHNELSLQSEVIAAVLRCENSDKRATIGQVVLHLINIRASKVIVQRTLDDLWHWGLLDKDEYSYRPNVKASAYRLNRKTAAWRLGMSMLAYNDDLSPHFQSELMLFREDYQTDVN